jgi:hypothetical protein
MKKVMLAGAATAVLLAVAAAASANSRARPTISGFAVTPSSLPAAGGTVDVTAHVKHASKCMLVIPDRGSRWVGCASGYLSTPEKFFANSTPSTYTTSAHIVAYNKYGRAWSRVVSITVWAQSSNWSGYVVPSSALVTHVSGAWTVPTLECSVTPNGGVGTWAGIGGDGWPTGGKSLTLLHTGISATCVNGLPRYAGWCEEYPSIPNTSRYFSGFPVSPGDSIEASVFRSDTGAWETEWTT